MAPGHRRLIADRLVVAGDMVCHISSGGRATAHQLTPFAAFESDGQVTYPAATQAPAPIEAVTRS